MLGSKFSNFHERLFFHAYTLHTCFRIHSPYSYLVYTLQAHVRFKIFKFSQKFFFSCLHSPHMFRDSLSIQLFGLHSPSTCQVQNFQIFRRDHFFILTLSTHVSGFTLQTVIWFTLSKHMLGSKFSDFYERSFFHAYTLHTCFRVYSPYSYLVYTLQAHVRFKIFKFSREIIFSCLHSPHMFQGSLSIQMLHFKILYSYYNFIMCLNAPLNHECLTP